MKKTPKHRAFPHLLSEEALSKLRRAGLHVDDEPFFPENHLAYPFGYIVTKPASAGGNCIPVYNTYCKDNDGRDVLTDMPAVKLYLQDMNWIISVHEYAPGPGPGDFTLVCGSEDNAVAEIITYFFHPNENFQKALHAALR